MLHTLIGIGNAILDHLVDIVEAEIQMVPQKEATLKSELRELENLIIERMGEKEYWKSSNLGSGKELVMEAKKKRREAEREIGHIFDQGEMDPEEHLWLR